MCTAHFLLYRKVRPIKQKTLRMDAHSREEKGVACATTLGARVSQAKLFVMPKKEGYSRISGISFLLENIYLYIYSLLFLKAIKKSSPSV